MDQHVGDIAEYDYRQGGKLKLFDGTHPEVMRERVLEQNWYFQYEPNKVQKSVKDTLLDWIEARSGWRIGEYKNYSMI